MKRIHKKNFPSFILLDDDLFALTFAKEIIRGYSRSAEIITFSAPGDAIEYMEAEDFMPKHKDTVFLTDLHMPEMDGFALLERMENRFNTMRERLHIFVLSAAACPEEILRVSSYSCVVGFIDKPFSKDKLEQIIDCLMF
jgi:CheY-like chemotaxis protein